VPGDLPAHHRRVTPDPGRDLLLLIPGSYPARDLLTISIGQHPAPGHALLLGDRLTEDHPPRSIATTGCDQGLLSLDVDGSAFPSLGQRDPVVGELQHRYPGLRPVGFWSPYEAAAWAILSHRVRITQAASIKQGLAERLGARVEMEGRQLCAFPAPQVLRKASRLEGIPERKLPWLQAIAEAAIEGLLDGARLRSLEPSQALAQLRGLPGIGPFGAELILIRGAAHPDLFATHERRLHEEVARAYGLHDPSIGTLLEVAERWRPYRSWVALLLRRRREDETAEIASGRRLRR
jgi:DNA-3-methyladenine glycosylase II